MSPPKLALATLSLTATLSLAAAVYVQYRTIDTMLGAQAQQNTINMQLQAQLAVEQRRGDELAKELEEFQQWRLHITAASRMGWSQATRYIREFPLEFKGD